VRVPPSGVITLRKEQDVVARRGQVPAAERARVRRGLQVLRAPELPPARLGAHFPVVVGVVVVVVGFTAGFGHFALRDFSSRQLRVRSFVPTRALETLITSLETVAK
jgi:hypothetical protein